MKPTPLQLAKSRNTFGVSDPFGGKLDISIGNSGGFYTYKNYGALGE